MKPSLTLAIAFFSLMWSAAANAQDFSFTFDWSDLKLCTSGNPNRVKNPTFVVHGLPVGATGIYFRLTDKNVPQFNHGGGWVEIAEDGTVSPGAFSYLSPCPPGGQHTYEWTADARAAKNGKKLGRAKASRLYP